VRERGDPEHRGAADAQAHRQEIQAEAATLIESGRVDDAVGLYLEAEDREAPSAEACLRVAEAYARAGDRARAVHWALRVVDAGDDFVAWQGAAALCGDGADTASLETRAGARLAVLGSFTTSQLTDAVRLAALRLRIRLEVYECGYGQYRQEILDPGSGLYAFAPDLVLLAVHEPDLELPELTHSPEEAVEAELGRWTSLWDVLAERLEATVIQLAFATPAEAPLGHLALRLPGSRSSMTEALNLRLGEAAGDRVLLVDCDRLSALIGKEHWVEPRYWHMAKQGIALGAVPLVARHVAAVIAAALGLTRKCIVLDLDDTLWGGVVGESGVEGIRIGGDARGEAYATFQEYLLKLKRRGVVLAVCSKNNEADAREPFERRPEMRLGLDDFAMFVASWEPKPDQIRSVAAALDVGLDSLVFLDDNPAEREAVRLELPEVDVLVLGRDPSTYVRTLAGYLGLETARLTAEDAARTKLYRARAEIRAAEAGAATIEDFYRGLEMRLRASPFTDIDLPRIAQLVGKTNQFNLTTRRHGIERLRAFADDPSCVHLSFRLADRFVDHGLIGVLIALQRGDALEIDTFLMSCRVIGRTVELAMLAELADRAAELGAVTLRGTYIATPKNAVAANVYSALGFSLDETTEDGTTWVYDLRSQPPLRSEFVEADSSTAVAP
jgi:FkbH-like protein